jgi:hypothetical protein
MPKIELGRGQRAAIIGSTGSGKTQMLLALMRSFPYSPVYIMDTKGDESIAEFIKKEGKNAVKVFSIAELIGEGKKRKGADFIHILPSLDELAEPQMLDDYLQAIYNINKPCLVCIDEIYQVNVGLNGGRGLNGLLTRGRSKGMSVICCTQRPAWMSKFIMTESQMFFIYRLAPEDMDKLKKAGLPVDKNTKLDKYEFLMYKVGENKLEHYAPIPLDFDPGYTNETAHLKNWK